MQWHEIKNCVFDQLDGNECKDYSDKWEGVRVNWILIFITL